MGRKIWADWFGRVDGSQEEGCRSAELDEEILARWKPKGKWV